ncbi:T9SS type A sorting domain-containing protein [Neolewinella persica]|uniref:T9SS type A sorting domain-containing protein n=1 Tax=Neolewinella persica TaxID=70998 RepID=UPI00037341E9|nr:T9SS type A sorting domain-containing protein [Neolewinella persica]
MQRVLLFLFIALFCGGLSAQVVLEDFEGGVADLTWEAFEGVYDGPVMNTADTLLNTSEWCGQYTKAGDRAFSFFRAQVATPLDLSVNNQFSIQINAGAATQLLLKLEGGGNNIEKTVNIATANVWRTYTFDFSAAAGFTGLTDIILFFDPGVETSTDTYLFDNIIASPAGICAGTVPDPTILDDFECQRNATYGVPGFDDISVVANPAPGGINTSDGVGRYTDQEGGFHALVISYNSAIDLSTNNQLCLKVWAPVTGNLLFKLEGGVSPAFETGVPVEETETWVEICADFSSQSNANHTRLVFFLNAGQDGTGDIYFLDDITITPPPPAEALEDFEDGANLAWMPLNGDNALHGTFTGPIANPDATGDNTSDNVGQYVRGTSMFSTLTSVLPDGIDLSTSPQLNLDVWAPAGATKVTLQLRSAIEGAKSAEANITATETWQTLSFNFEAFADVTDFSDVNILFDSETAGTGTYYFDNLIQGESTVDACAGVAPDPSIVDDFECQRNANYTCCSAVPVPVNNPDVSMGNPSDKVGEFIDPPGAFDALVIEYPQPIDLSLRNIFSMKTWAPVAGQILFKLEGGTAANVEVFVDIPSTEEWVDYSVDLSAHADGGYTKLVLFFGAGTDNAEPNTYYIDDLRWNRAPFVSSCVSSFDDDDFTLLGWSYFANGALEGNEFMVVDNPLMDDVNSSATVGVFEEASDGEPFAGSFADPDAPIALPNDNKVVTMKVLMDVAGQVVLKLEGGLDGAPASGDVTAEYTTAGAWQELTFNMSVLPDDARYSRITIIPNFGVVPTENLTHYFDDISVGGGSCMTTSIFNPVVIKDLRAYPNPVGEQLTIENAEGARTFQLTDMLGRRVRQLTVSGARTQVQWEVNGLPVGTYVLTARGENGSLVARTMIIKE